MSLRLYGYWRSSAAYRVRIALHLKGLEFEYVPVSLKPGVAEHRDAAYRAQNPQMLVPFLEDGEVAIGQSMAMLEYLEEAYPQTPLLPDTAAARGRVRAFCQAIACDIHPLQNLRVLQYIEKSFAGDRRDWSTHWIREGFKALETMAGDGPCVFGSTPTLADVLLAPQMYNVRRFEMPTEDYPKLVAAVDHCNQLSAFQAAAPEVQPDAPND